LLEISNDGYVQVSDIHKALKDVIMMNDKSLLEEEVDSDVNQVMSTLILNRDAQVTKHEVRNCLQEGIEDIKRILPQ
jgi:hypothetical protein